MLDPLITAVLTTEVIRNMHQETEKESHHMDPFIAGIAIHEASRNRVQQDEKEQQLMDPFIFHYAKIRYQERLEEATNARRGEITPPLSSRLFAFVRRIVQAALSVRVTLVVHTQADQGRRALTEPDVCIE